MESNFNSLRKEVIDGTEYYSFKSDCKVLIEQLAKMEKAGELKNLMIAGTLKDDKIITGNANCDIFTSHNLISYMNVDTIKRQLDLGYISTEDKE